jgi:hypothetical protein
MTTRNILAQILIIICSVWLSGCATLTRGTTEPYTVISDPPGATATFSSGETCFTPCTVAKKRKESFNVTIEKIGYLPVDIMVESQTCDAGRVATAGNLVLVGSLVWFGIDQASGATRNLTPNPCEITLEPMSGQETGG